MSERTELSYRAVLEALWSLRGPVEGERAPSERAVRYRRSSARGVAPTLDVYAPERADGRSVILVHGGGFFVGARDMKPMRVLASRLSAAGLTVASIDYRLILRGGRLEEALDDVRAARAYWRTEVTRRGLDPARVSMIGLSAGATLTMLSAGDDDRGVHRVVSCFGLYELDHLEGPLATLMPRLLFRTEDRARWAARSPRGSAQPVAPTLLLHGTHDGLVPVGQARRLAAHRESLGLPTKLAIYEGAPHGFFNQQGAHAAAATREILAHLA
jgi:acetyl esterase/lipase